MGILIEELRRGNKRGVFVKDGVCDDDFVMYREIFVTFYLFMLKTEQSVMMDMK